MLVHVFSEGRLNLNSELNLHRGLTTRKYTGKLVLGKKNTYTPNLSGEKGTIPTFVDQKPVTETVLFMFIMR